MSTDFREACRTALEDTSTLKEMLTTLRGNNFAISSEVRKAQKEMVALVKTDRVQTAEVAATCTLVAHIAENHSKIVELVESVAECLRDTRACIAREMCAAQDNIVGPVTEEEAHTLEKISKLIHGSLEI